MAGVNENWLIALFFVVACVSRINTTRVRSWWA